MNQETLLIVEDNDMLRDGLREILEVEGFAVRAASNGLHALSLLESFSPDLIVSDIVMPEMDGYRFFEAVRSHAQWTAIPFIFLTAKGEPEEVLAGKQLGVEDYLIKPFSHAELLTTIRSRLDRTRQLRVAQLQQAYETSLVMLANAIEVRDYYTRGHVERVTAYSLSLAGQLGWNGTNLQGLRIGAILHDIGKIHVSERILGKTGPLDPNEWDEIKRHPINGVEMIKDIPYLAPGIPVVRHHHERWDGKGYPDGLTGEDIPLAARIVSVADGFDAMTTDRPYRPARTSEQAYHEILRNAGAQYDPAVVNALSLLWESHRWRNGSGEASNPVRNSEPSLGD